MSWWWSFKNIYGLIMGTSTDFMKKKNRPHWPTKMHKIDENLSVFLGGTGNCGILRDGNKVLLINCNSGESTLKLKKALPEGMEVTLLGTSVFPDYIGGRDQFQLEDVLIPGSRLGFSDSETYEFTWGDEEVEIIEISNAFSICDWVIYLQKRKVLFVGGLAFNSIHPLLDLSSGLNTKNWISVLEELKNSREIEWVVPHEGDLGDSKILTTFSKYLTALNSPSVSFSYCRENFDWIEISGHSSLEENFEILKSKKS